MKFCVISDTHMSHSDIPYSDILGKRPDCIIHCGDALREGTNAELHEFLKWYGRLYWKSYSPIKILISGNHDRCLAGMTDSFILETAASYGVRYLPWGIHSISNWQSGDMVSVATDPTIRNGSAPHACTDGHNDNKLRLRAFEKFSGKIDILITHSPPEDILAGYVTLHESGCGVVKTAGSAHIRRVNEVLRPKVHVFGHVHDSNGVWVDKEHGCKYINASMVGIDPDRSKPARYPVIFKPIFFTI